MPEVKAEPDPALRGSAAETVVLVGAPKVRGAWLPMLAPELGLVSNEKAGGSGRKVEAPNDAALEEF
jgi:hypothetical protein